MTRTHVSSSNLESVGYDQNTQTLEVEFKNGNIYQYFDVPEIIFSSLRTASSAGEFFINHIKGVYRYARV